MLGDKNRKEKLGDKTIKSSDHTHIMVFYQGEGQVNFLKIVYMTLSTGRYLERKLVSLQYYTVSASEYRVNNSVSVIH